MPGAGAAPGRRVPAEGGFYGRLRWIRLRVRLGAQIDESQRVNSPIDFTSIYRFGCKPMTIESHGIEEFYQVGQICEVRPARKSSYAPVKF